MGHTKVRCKEPLAEEIDEGNFGNAGDDAGWDNGGQANGDHKVADDGWTAAPAVEASVW